jgi:tetratricopeptide (TPR) repeat protein
MDEYHQLLARAHELNLLRRYEDALHLLGSLAASHPDSVSVHCETALALYHLGCLEEALAAASAGVRADPERDWPHRLQAVVLLASRRPGDALVSARAAASLAPHLPEALSVLAQAEAAVGEYEQAYATASELTRVAPEIALSHTTMGEVAMARRDWRLAEQAYREALRLDPQHWAAMNNLGVALQRQGRRRDALAMYQEAARLDPSGEVSPRNIVALVRPAISAQQIAYAAVLAIVAPVAVPLVLGWYLIKFIRSQHLRGELRPGARMYYDRVMHGSGVIRWDVAALCVAAFILGFAGLSIVGKVDAGLVSNSVPTIVLAVTCAAVAATPTAAWAVRRIRDRLRPPSS